MHPIAPAALLSSFHPPLRPHGPCARKPPSRGLHRNLHFLGSRRKRSSLQHDLGHSPWGPPPADDVPQQRALRPTPPRNRCVTRSLVSFSFTHFAVGSGYPNGVCRCRSVAQSCPTLCHPMDCSTPGFPVLHYLPKPCSDSRPSSR